MHWNTLKFPTVFELEWSPSETKNYAVHVFIMTILDGLTHSKKVWTYHLEFESRQTNFGSSQKISCCLFHRCWFCCLISKIYLSWKLWFLARPEPVESTLPPRETVFAFSLEQIPGNSHWLVLYVIKKKKKQYNATSLKSNVTCIKLMRCINPLLSFQRRQEGRAHIKNFEGERVIGCGGMVCPCCLL